MANDNEILRRIKDFIRGKGTPEDITYRWYNYFNAGCNKYLDIAKGKNTGCDFPESWLTVKSPKISLTCVFQPEFP